ncbi:calcium-binding tyrosine phosphorylation-regulated protein [Hyla sarda]|uniref:calcium-binding tyrosine phosphorylation-regulated protein n=1 Tax=Hyla sarda TaxID=327740 RepID=UPI0024C35B3A|nr:calcium-binding tyrosine phosphorylation-regulated protein [Hyla sarda]
MSTKPRLLVPFGLKTLLEGLSRAVVTTQPNNIPDYASYYFAELLKYRRENPTMDFKNLVQEFQRRQNSTQTQFGPADNPISRISSFLVSKDKAESEIVETENAQCLAKQDPCAGNASLAEAMTASLNGELKYPLLYRDISNPLISAHRVYSHLHPREEASGAAGAEYKDSVKHQHQEQTSSGMEASAEQSAEDPERLENVSTNTQSQPTKTLGRKASASGAVPKKLNGQALYSSTREKAPDRQYSLPRGVSSNGRRTNGASTSFSALIPEITISKLQNSVTFDGDVHRIVSKMSHHPPDYADSSAPGSAIYLSKKTIESRLPEVVPPTQGVAQMKIMSTEHQQRTREMLPSNLYQIQISVDKPVRQVCYEPVYIPDKKASRVHIVTAVPTASVNYIAAPEEIPRENIQTPAVICRHPSQDPGQYKSVYVPSQTGSSPWCVCQLSALLHMQQPTYRKTENSKYSAHVEEKPNSPEVVNKPGYSDASSQVSALDINHAYSSSVQQNLMGSPGEDEPANLKTIYQHCNLRRTDQSVNSQCNAEQLQSQTPKYKEFLLCTCKSDLQSSNGQPLLITSPVHMVDEEAKQVASPPPYILIGSSEWKKVHAVQSINEQDFQRFTTPSPFASTKPNTGNQMQNLSIRHDPAYLSIAVPLEEMHGASATPSITHIAETRSIPSFGNSIAIAVATSRCPYVRDELD